MRVHVHVCEAQGGFVASLFVILMGISRIYVALRTLGRGMPYRGPA